MTDISLGEILRYCSLCNRDLLVLFGWNISVWI